MPKYVVHLKSSDGKEFRRVALMANSEDEARAEVQRREYQIAAFRLSDERLADIDAMDDAGRHALRGTVLAHEQDEPYKITSVVERKG